MSDNEAESTKPASNVVWELKCIWIPMLLLFWRHAQVGKGDGEPHIAMTFARYLSLAETTIVEIERLAAEATVFLQTSGYEMTQRDAVMAGLLSKPDGTFRALIEDSRSGRGEAMHHLKTMAEVFIYFYVVSADDTDRTADGIIAERVAEENARRLRRLTPTSERLKFWESFRDEMRQEAVKVGNLAELADGHSSELGGWYAHVYRLACQSAHLGDLLDWMPLDDGRILVGEAARAKTGPLKASIAIEYGVDIALGLLEAINNINVAGLRVDTVPFRRELAAIREAKEGA